MRQADWTGHASAMRKVPLRFEEWFGQCSQLLDMLVWTVSASCQLSLMLFACELVAKP